ncbi:MAG: DUF2071 domain-containing protein [Blastocatellia bacterium]|nr:DUF2071 domain-containing protein [Blastocatellia bacterium]
MKLAMVGHLSRCILLAYRAPVSSVIDLIPDGLELVTRDGWAFWNIVACRIESMRPAGLPGPFGVSYHHVAYRLYVRAETAGGEIVEGLYFVRSDADKFLMSKAGNLLSDFRFHTANISLTVVEDRFTLDVRDSSGGAGDAHFSARSSEDARLSDDSCFASFDEAARFLKYRPLGLSCDADRRWLKVAEVFRDESRWDEKPLSVTDARWSFFDHMNQRDVQLELATRVAPIAYRWRLGRRERLAGA